MQYKQILTRITVPACALATLGMQQAWADETATTPKFNGEVSTKIEGVNKQKKTTVSPATKFKLGVREEMEALEGSDNAAMEAEVSVKHDGKEVKVGLPKAFVTLPMWSNKLELKMGRDESVFNGDPGFETWQMGLSSDFGLEEMKFGLNVEQAAPILYWLPDAKKRVAGEIIAGMKNKDAAEMMRSDQLESYLAGKGEASKAFKKKWNKKLVAYLSDHEYDVPIAPVLWMTWKRKDLVYMKVAFLGRVMLYNEDKGVKDGKPTKKKEKKFGIVGGGAVDTTWTVLPEWTKVLAAMRAGQGICPHIGGFAAKYNGTEQGKLPSNAGGAALLWSFQVALEPRQFLVKDKLELCVEYAIEGAGEPANPFGKKKDQEIGWRFLHMVSPTLKYYLLNAADKKLRLDVGGGFDPTFDKKSKEAAWCASVGLKANFA